MITEASCKPKVRKSKKGKKKSQSKKSLEMQLLTDSCKDSLITEGLSTDNGISVHVDQDVLDNIVINRLAETQVNF